MQSVLIISSFSGDKKSLKIYVHSFIDSSNKLDSYESNSDDIGYKRCSANVNNKSFSQLAFFVSFLFTNIYLYVLALVVFSILSRITTLLFLKIVVENEKLFDISNCCSTNKEFILFDTIMFGNICEKILL